MTYVIIYSAGHISPTIEPIFRKRRILASFKTFISIRNQNSINNEIITFDVITLVGVL